MLKSLRSTIIAIMILGGLGARPCNSAPLSITPFHTFNQSPLVQIYGLPAAETAIIRPLGHTWTLLALDVANNYATHNTSQEEIVLDGESYRLTLALRHGVSEKLEIGLDLPLMSHSGGIFDGLIEDWHNFFGLRQPAAQLLIGGTYAFSSRTALDIAFSEDISVATSSDVALHVAVSHEF